MSGVKRRKTESMKATAETREASEPSVAAVDTDQSESASADVYAEESGEVAALRQQVEAGKDRYLRLMAEFDNYKRRSGKEYERLVSAANEKLILEMVDVRENFERALKSGGAGGEFAPFYEGMKLIFAKYDEVLTRNGLTPFAAAGEPFDPMIHDALMKAPNAQIPADCVAEVFERGYRLNDKVIKHARVVVSSGGGG
jgi:molecular chaperone GrpE